MGRDPEPGIATGGAADKSFAMADQVGKPIDRVAEALLAALQGLPGAAAMLIEYRQQCQTDAGFFGSRHDPIRQLSRIGIGDAVGLVMEIMEFAHRGIARLGHLHEGQGRDRFHLLRRQLVEKSVHDGAPRPEAVGGIGAARLAHARHGTLEGVAVDIRGRWHQHLRAEPRVARSRRNIGLDGSDRAGAVDRDAHVSRPPFRQQCAFRKQTLASLHRRDPVA